MGFEALTVLEIADTATGEGRVSNGSAFSVLVVGFNP
jgi:hypothetical protein